LSFDRVGRINLYFKKIQNGVVLIKKKKQKLTGCNRVFDRVNPPGRPGHDFSYFFINSTRFQSQVNLLDQTGFQNYDPRTI
jgi:hypothetical protein